MDIRLFSSLEVENDRPRNSLGGLFSDGKTDGRYERHVARGEQISSSEYFECSLSFVVKVMHMGGTPAHA